MYSPDLLADGPKHSGADDEFISSIEPAVVRYLGPPNSFSEDAAMTFFGTDIEKERARRSSGWRPPLYIHHENFSQVTEAVYHDHSDALTVGILPVENSRTSAIQTVTDALLTGDYYVLGEGNLLVKIQFASTSETMDGIRTVYSQSKAFGQSSDFLERHHFVIKEEVDSTSLAASIVAASEDPLAAALCSRRAAESNGLHILEADVNDDPNNQTRFLIVQSREGRHAPDLGMLAMGGKLRHRDRSATAKVAGIVSPRRPAEDYGFMDAMNRVRTMGLNWFQLGKRNTQREPAGGSSDYFVEFVGNPRVLYDVFNNESSYNKVMAFRLLGVYATGSLYEA